MLRIPLYHFRREYIFFEYGIMDNSNFSFDVQELVKRIIKYVFEGLIVAVAAFLIPGKVLKWEEIVTIGIIAAATFSVLDLFAPSFSDGARNGASFGIGLSLTNTIPGGGPVFH